MRELVKSSPTVKQIVDDLYHKCMFDHFGDKYLAYRETWNAATKQDIYLDFPLHIDFELANSCNYRCSFCPYSLAPSKRPAGFNVRGSKIISLDLIKSVLGQANGRLFAVELGYNTEPLLHPHVLDIAQMCRDYGVLDIRMGTNGSLLGKVDFQQILDSGITQLQVSIDAIDDQTYLESRNSSQYRQVVSSIRDFVAFRDSRNALFPRLRVTYVKTSSNAKYTDRFIRQWAGMADIIGIQDLIVYPDVQLAVPQDTLEGRDLDSSESCYMPKVRLSIRSDGTVHPCCTVPGMKLIVGNLHRQSVESIWNSKAMRTIRQSHYGTSWKKNNICAACISNTLKEKVM